MSDAAITILVAGLINIATMVIGFLTLWIKVKYGVDQVKEVREQATVVEKKVDNNTIITKAGTDAAANNAKAAATTAAEAKVATQAMVRSIDKKLNGGLDSALAIAIDPVKKALQDHATVDDNNMKEINNKFAELTDYVHKHSHQTMNALQTQANKIEVIVEMLKKDGKK